MTNTYETEPLLSSTIEEAADWFLRIRDSEMSETELALWQDWIEGDESHMRAYDEIVQLWGCYDKLDAIPKISKTALAGDSYDASAPIPIQSGGMKAKTAMSLTRRAIFTGLTAIAATVALVFVSSDIITPDSIWSPTIEDYQTQVAEHREITLADGSHISLGAMSHISVELTDKARRLTLHSGEALFEVEKDPERPFLVTAGPSTVRAVGTAFNVKIGPQEVTVTVVEGEVRVSRAYGVGVPEITGVAVREGQKVDFAVAGEVGIVETADVALATMWHEGRLIYIEQSLEAVMADINRYTSPEIIIADQTAKTLVFTGTVFQNDVKNWLAGLEKVFPVRVVDLGGKGVLIISNDTERTLR